MRYTPDSISELAKGEVFVFGSNLAGRHGKGAAKIAHDKFGAIYGQGYGRQGMSYAIPTKNQNLNVLTLGRIRQYVKAFLDYACFRPEITFLVTKIGCGLAGLSAEDIAPMFAGASSNVILPKEFHEIINRDISHTYETGQCIKCEQETAATITIRAPGGEEWKSYLCSQCAVEMGFGDLYTNNAGSPLEYKSSDGDKGREGCDVLPEGEKGLHDKGCIGDTAP